MYRVVLEIRKLSTPQEKREAWNIFKQHHYLTHEFNVAGDCYVGYWEGTIVCFYSVLRYPSGSVKNAYRGSRLVVLPDFQGMGIGTRFSEVVAEYYIKNGFRFFAKTANRKLGKYRDASPKWKGTSKNHKRRKDVFSSKKASYNNIVRRELAMRLCYSHEYIG